MFILQLIYFDNNQVQQKMGKAASNLPAWRHN